MSIFWQKISVFVDGRLEQLHLSGVRDNVGAGQIRTDPEIRMIGQGGRGLSLDGRILSRKKLKWVKSNNLLNI